MTLECELIGRWRIVESDMWAVDHLDLVKPASITIRDDGHGEIAFGALQAGLDCEYSPTIVHFTWQGSEEMDEVRGNGSAELGEDGSLEIEFRYQRGDEAILTARRW